MSIKVCRFLFFFPSRGSPVAARGAALFDKNKKTRLVSASERSADEMEILKNVQ